MEKGESWEEIKKNTEEDMRKIVGWLNENHMVLNVDKTNIVKFELKNTKIEEPEILIHSNQCEKETLNRKHETCQKIKQVEHAKYLGVTVDKKLNWKEHIKQLTMKLMKPIYMALQLQNILPNPIKRTVYMALIQSKLQYGISSWGAAHRTNLDQLIKAQKKFLKILYKKKRRFSSEQLFRETNVLKIEDLYEISTLKYIKKNGLTQYKGEGKKETRHNPLTLNVPRVRTNMGKMNGVYRGIQNFNGLRYDERQEILNADMRKYKTIIKKIVKERKKRTH